MQLIDELNNIKWKELTNDLVKRIHVHTTLPSLLKASKCKYMHEEPGTLSMPRLFYIRIGVNNWEVHGLSWELSQFLKMQPTKSPSSKVAPIESISEDSQVKVEDKIEEVSEEVSTKTVDSDDSVETESTEMDKNNDDE